jgi:fatty acid synthase subunit alpha
MLGNVTSSLVNKLLERYYDGDASKVPMVDYLAPAVIAPSYFVESAKEKNNIVFSISEDVPEPSVWLENLAGPHLNWLRAILTSPTIVRGTSYVDNPLKRLLAPRPGQKVIVLTDGSAPTGLEIYGATRSFGIQKPSFKAVEIQYTASSGAIDLTLFEDRREISVPLQLQFKYVPSTGSVPIHEVADGRNNRIKDFYWRLWFGDNEVLPSISVRETFSGPEVTIQTSDIETFCAVVGNEGESFKTARKEKVQAPMDFGIVTGWQVSNLVSF